MKKTIGKFLLLCVMLVLVGYGGILLLFFSTAIGDGAAKDKIFEFVREEETALLTAIEQEEFSAFGNQGFIKEIDADSDVVDFSCGGAGLGAATSYVGFYYTADDDMTAVWCAPPSSDSLTPSGNGFEWQEPDGDNRYYTEHICGNFYYYEASF